MLFLYDIEPEIIFIFHSRHVIEMKVYVSRAISITLIHDTEITLLNYTHNVISSSEVLSLSKYTFLARFKPQI